MLGTSSQRCGKVLRSGSLITVGQFTVPRSPTTLPFTNQRSTGLSEARIMCSLSVVSRSWGILSPHFAFDMRLVHVSMCNCACESQLISPYWIFMASPYAWIPADSICRPRPSGNASSPSRRHADHGADIAGGPIPAPDHILVWPDQDEPGLVPLQFPPVAIANGLQGDPERACRLFEAANDAVVGIERQKGIARPELLEYVAARGERLRREMVAGARLEHVRAVRAAFAFQGAGDHRRSLVIRLVALHPRPAFVFARLPRPLEFLPIALRVVARQESGIFCDPRRDEILAN